MITDFSDLSQKFDFIVDKTEEDDYDERLAVTPCAPLSPIIVQTVLAGFWLYSKINDANLLPSFRRGFYS